LTVFWQQRIHRWGLFSYHYLPKNLGCMLSILPWRPAPADAATAAAPFQINTHGLALWFTTPLFLWLARTSTRRYLPIALLVCSAFPAVQNLLYQNSGWAQFGYRFSNDYSLLWAIALTISLPRISNAVKLAAFWGIAWNLFGAMSFERPKFGAFYTSEPTQRILYQDD
jgi:hypothetical protein